MTSGGTLLVTFSSLQIERNERNLENNSDQQENKSPRAEVGMSDDWGIRIFHSKQYLTSKLQSNLFPNELSWACHLFIDPTKPDWEPIAKPQALPILLQRKFHAAKFALPPYS